MKNKKLIGSFYTPKIISDFLVDHLSSKLKDVNSISVLEPSAGDGSFISSICNHKSLFKKINKITVVEKEKKELEKIKAIDNSKHLKTHHDDFLSFQKNTKRTFSLVIGNPPYIKKNYLTKKQIAICEEIHRQSSLSNKKIKNIWTSFLVSFSDRTKSNKRSHRNQVAR